MTTYNIKSHILTRVLSLAILCAMLLSLSLTSVLSAQDTASAGITENTFANITAHKSYKIKLKNAVYVSSDNGKTLTDTKYSSIELEDEEFTYDGWTAIRSYNNETEYRVTVTIDLGYIAKGVSLFYFRAFKGIDVLAEMPTRSRIYISTDNDSFTLVGEPSTVTDITQDYASAVYTLKTEKQYNARYIRFTLDCDGTKHLYLNEMGAGVSGNIYFASGSDTVTDNQGVIYKLQDGKAHVIGTMDTQPKRSGTIAPSTESFNENNKTYKLGVGSDNEITVISDFIGEDSINYSGVPNNVQYIVIHNTGTTERNTDAERYNYRMHNTVEEKSWHYTVDNKIIYHSLTDSIVGWHAGASHNYESIGIEICTNGAPKRSSGKFIFSGESYENWLETHFRPALKNAAMLTAELLTRYGLGMDAVIQHYDVTEKNCPLWLRYKDGKYVHDGTLWIEFMGYVEEYYTLLNGKTASTYWTLTEDIILPDYIKATDGKVYPVTHIDSDAFTDKYDSIRTITLGKMVSDISPECFFGSIGIESVIPNENVNFYTDDSRKLYSKNGSIIFDPSDYIGITPDPKADCTLNIKEHNGKHYIICSNEKYSLKDIATNFGAEIYTAKQRDGTELTDSNIPVTGTLINMDGARLYMVTKGDIDGSGAVDSLDYIYVKRACLKSYKPKQYEIYAMALTNGESVETLDYIKIKRHVMKTYNIYK